VEGFSLFNTGFSEIVLILVIAAVVLGPQRIRQVARWLGRLSVQGQRLMRDFRRQLNSELDAVEREEFREVVDDLRALRQEMDQLRQDVLRGPASLREEAEQAIRSAVPAEGAGSENRIGGQRAWSKIDAGLPKPVDVADDPTI
jgi:sec-independent protein translocase protein TatB